MTDAALMPFLEKLLQVLAQGSFSSTYKYAVLLALTDLCLEAGHPPTVITTRQLARRVVELYWPQVREWQENERVSPRVLRQNTTKPARIPSLVAAFRARNPGILAVPRSARVAMPGWARLLDDVERVLIEMPLPKLQRVGGEEERFIYQRGWDQTPSPARIVRYQGGESSAFDNRLLLQAGAAEALIALAPIVRPLVQQHWLTMVRQINGLAELELEQFFFGAERARLAPIAPYLHGFQGGRCFYCTDLLGGAGQVDHFLPWARYPDDGLDNLVLTHSACNRDKLAFLADLDLAQRWRIRSEEEHEQLEELAESAGWPRDRARTFGVVASVYRTASPGIRLWGGKGRLFRLEIERVPAVHAFGIALTACPA